MLYFLCLSLAVFTQGRNDLLMHMKMNYIQIQYSGQLLFCMSSLGIIKILLSHSFDIHSLGDIHYLFSQSILLSLLEQIKDNKNHFSATTLFHPLLILIVAFVPAWLMTVQTFMTIALLASMTTLVTVSLVLVRWPLQFVMRYEWHLTGFAFCCQAATSEAPLSCFQIQIRNLLNLRI